MRGGWRRSAAKCAALVVVAAVLAAPSIANGATVGWTGAAPTGAWSLGANWSGGSVPVSPVDQVDFPQLGAPCDTVGGEGCYAVVDDAGIVDVGLLDIDSRWPYTITPAGANDRIELTAADPNFPTLLVNPFESGQDTLVGPVTPVISVPVTVMNDQVWQVAAGGDQSGGIEVDDVAGSSSSLQVSLGEPLYTTSLSTGRLTLGGTAPLVVEPNPTNPADQPQLPAAGTFLSDASDLTVAAPSTASGPILAYSANLEGSVLTIGAGSAPDGTLDVSGYVDLHQSDKPALEFYIDGAASTGSTPTPSTDYAQLSASGSVDLGGAALTVNLGTDPQGNCEDLVPGQVYTLLSAATISGELIDPVLGQPLPDGSVVSLQNQCDSWVGPMNSPTVRINYNTSSTPETITATVVSGGHAGDFPMLTGASPQISGLVSGAPYAGLQLSASSGGWSGNPTRYDYTWYSCSAAQGPDCNNAVGDDLPTYTPTSDDVGNTIEACVDATNSYGWNVDQYCSDATTAVELPPVPELTQGAVTITGSDQIGDTLTAVPGSWSWYPSFAYQWQRCDALGTACVDIASATAATYLLTSADVAQFVRLKLTASNPGGSTVAYSGISAEIQGGPVKSVTLLVEPSESQVRSALVGIRDPSNTAVIRALIKTRKFRTTFAAPSAGLLKVTWTTRVSSGKGKHRRPRNVKVATGLARISAAGAAKLLINLTPQGHNLLREHPRRLAVTATEKFEPSGGVWTSVTKRFWL
jgi:hypothetical protein